MIEEERRARREAYVLARRRYETAAKKVSTMAHALQELVKIMQSPKTTRWLEFGQPEDRVIAPPPMPGTLRMAGYPSANEINEAMREKVEGRKETLAAYAALDDLDRDESPRLPSELVDVMGYPKTA